MHLKILAINNITFLHSETRDFENFSKIFKIIRFLFLLNDENKGVL